MTEWIPTPQSSNVDGYSYDAQSEVLTIGFKSGTRYEYYDVPQPVFDELRSAESIGKYFNSTIKSSYRYARV